MIALLRARAVLTRWGPIVGKLYKLHDKDQRAVEASTWIAKLDRELSSEEKREIRHWIGLDPRNKTVLSEMAVLWDEMDSLSRLSELFPHPVTETVENNRRRNFGIAAGIALLAAILLSNFFPDRSFENPLQPQVVAESAVFQTNVGELSEITLSEGSLLTLNTDSLVEIQFDEKQRNIHMQRGELHIEVAHDPSRPLNVLVGDRMFQAVGTAFAVRIDDQQRIELLVTDGMVRVGLAPDVSANAITPGQPEGSLSVTKGQWVMLDQSSHQLEVLHPDDIEVQLSWRNGNLVFRGESLGEATAEISRYTTVEFIFLDEDLQKIRVAGLFRAGDIDGFLSSLNANFDIVHQQIDEGTIQLSSSTVAAN
jgi:transmembrane sensor